MKNQCRLTIATLALACTCTTTAQTVYKSVDAQGRVTYSSSAPAAVAEEMVEEVPIAPGPTALERREAERRAMALEGTTRQAEQQRQERARKTEQAVSEAKRELDDAKLGLEEARIKGDDDWQTIASGGRVLKQSYLDRVAAAEQRVKQAQKALRNARSGSR